MIICHKHKFVFLKTGKTGGSSVEIALSGCCGDLDIITPMTPRDEYLRLQIGRPCQNFMFERTNEVEYLDQLRRVGPSLALPKKLLSQALFRNHMPFEDIAAANSFALEGYTKVTIERHPYEKAVSYANFVFGFEAYKLTGKMSASLAEIQATLDRILRTSQLAQRIRNWHIYTVDGEVIADHVLQHATLASDFDDFVRDAQLPSVPPLPQTKVGTRNRDIAASEILTASQRTEIQDICAEEFAYFGYAR